MWNLEEKVNKNIMLKDIKNWHILMGRMKSPLLIQNPWRNKVCCVVPFSLLLVSTMASLRMIGKSNSGIYFVWLFLFFWYTTILCDWYLFIVCILWLFFWCVCVINIYDFIFGISLSILKVLIKTRQF